MYSIIKNHIVTMRDGYGRPSELYSCILFDIVLECFCHIIIEHIRIGTRVHTNDRFSNSSRLFVISFSIKVKSGTGSE